MQVLCAGHNQNKQCAASINLVLFGIKHIKADSAYLTKKQKQSLHKLTL